MFADTIPEPPKPSGLDVLFQLLPAFAVELAIVLVVAFFVARIGGLPGTAAAAASTAPGSGRRSLLLTLVVAGVAALFGILIGREVAREISVGGLAGIVAIGLIVLVVLVVIGLVLVALFATAFRHGHPTRAIGRIVLAAAVLALATALGKETAVATGGAYPQPVILAAGGTVQIRLESAGMPFAPKTTGPIQCRSVQDGRDVQEVAALELGELGPGTLQAVVSIGPGGRPGDSSMILAIDLADVAVALQPTWEVGPFPTTTVTSGNASGTMTFKLDRNVDPAAPGDWPKTLSGEISWSCQPW